MESSKKLRPSPSQHASKTPLGTEAQGNDGNTYIVTERKNGKYWKLKSSKVKEEAKVKVKKETKSRKEPRPKEELKLKDQSKSNKAKKTKSTQNCSAMVLDKYNAVMQKYREKNFKVKLPIYFHRTADKNDEKSPTTSELEHYLKDNVPGKRHQPRYLAFLDQLFGYGDYMDNFDEILESVKFKRQGNDLWLCFRLHSLPPRLIKTKAYVNRKTGHKLPAECIIQSPVYTTRDDVLTEIMTSSFEDGIYEGRPGMDLIYPDKARNELGVIDCRDRERIQIKEV